MCVKYKMKGHLIVVSFSEGEIRLGERDIGSFHFMFLYVCIFAFFIPGICSCIAYLT